MKDETKINLREKTTRNDFSPKKIFITKKMSKRKRKIRRGNLNNSVEKSLRFCQFK